MRLGYSLDEVLKEIKKEGCHIFNIYNTMLKDRDKSAGNTKPPTKSHTHPRPSQSKCKYPNIV